MAIMHLIPSLLLVAQWFEHSPLWVQYFPLHPQENVTTGRSEAILGEKNDILIYWSKEKESVSTITHGGKPPETSKAALNFSLTTSDDLI